MPNLLRRIKHWFRAGRLQAELAEELETHRAMTQERLERSGLSTTEAQGASRRALGNVTLAREDARRVWIWPWLESVYQDLRYAVRSLRRQPGFAIASVVTLGFAIGLNTSLATAFSAMLWRPWAVTDATTLVQILKTRDAEFLFSDYRQLSQDTRLMTMVATNCGRQSRLEDCRMMLDDEKVTPQFVSGNYFRTLGVRMEHGRGFVEDEDHLSTPTPVAVMSHSLWQRRFGSDAGVVGRSVDLDGVPFTVIGVTAREFSGTSLLRRDIWVPLAASQLLRPSERSAMWVEIAARLHPGVTREQARAELQSLVRSEDPRFGRVQLTDTSLLVASNEREDIYAFFAALLLGVLLVLLLACANVGNLLLARTLARGREIAVRASLGAGRGRLVRQLLTESVVLSCAAAIVGLWIARVLPAFILEQAFQASELGRVAFALKPDGWVLMFTVGLAILTCFAFALAPALYASRRNVADALRDGDGMKSGRFPLRAIFLSVQIAASVVLLVGAMLLVRGIQQANTRNLGFDVNGVTVLSFQPPASYPPARIRAFGRDLVSAITPLGASRGFAVASAAPLSSASLSLVRLPGETRDRGQVVSQLEVSPSYFDVLGIALVVGRTLKLDDAGTSGIVINEALARRYWPGESPLGRTVMAGPTRDRETARQVVGVVSDADTEGATLSLEPVPPRMYELLTADSAFAARSPGNNERAAPEILLRGGDTSLSLAISALSAELDPLVKVRRTSLSSRFDARFSEGRFMAALAAGLGATALLLACVGVFGVFGYVVRQQTREIGIRLALGARADHVIRSVLNVGGRALLIGLAVGLGSAGAGAQVIRSALHGLSPLDPVSYIIVIGILAVAAIVAIAVPAWRATRIDPIAALRCD